MVVYATNEKGNSRGTLIQQETILLSTKRKRGAEEGSAEDDGAKDDGSEEDDAEVTADLEEADNDLDQEI